MRELIEYILAVAGLTYTVTKTTIFKEAREYLSKSRFGFLQKIGIIISCPACFGFWASLLLLIFDYHFIYYPFIGFIGVIIIFKSLQT